MNTTTTRTIALPAPRIATLRIVVGIAIASMLAGGVLAARMVADGRAGVRNPDGSFPIGEPARTAFGWVAVTHVEKIAGLTAKDLAGATHGIQNLVKPDDQQVQVTVQLTSGEARDVVAYSPEQFRLVVGTGRRTIAPASSTILRGTLQPYAAVEGHLGFVVPRDGAHLWLRYDDGTREPVLVDLGTTDHAPATVPAPHH